VASSIRRARPEDADFIAWVILTSQRGHLLRGWFDVALNRPELECLSFVRRLAVARTHSWWHTSKFLVADAEGVAVAALCALPAAGAMSASRSAIEEVASSIGLDVAEQTAFWRRGAYVGKCWMAGDDDAWLVEHVATVPSYRGAGLARTLLQDALNVGREHGFQTAQITFYVGNEAAESSYSKAGFQFAEEKRHPDFEAVTGASGLRRFARNI
jgi:GNAT superfamily N-acetyltransferase